MAANTKVDTIIDGIRSRILSGEFGEEGRLPSFRKLVAEYETSQETMNKAMQALQAEGLLLSAGAKGVYVNTPNVHVLGYTPDFYEYLKNQKFDAVEEYIEPAKIVEPSSEVAEVMHLQKEELVFRRFKKQGTKQEIYRIVETFYPKSILTEESIEKMTKNLSFKPLETIKKRFKLFITHLNEKLLVRLPTAKEQELLKIVRTNPVIELQRIAYSKNNKVIFYTHMILNANHFLLSYNYEVDDWK